MTGAKIYTDLAAVMDDCKSVAKRDRNEHQRFLFRGIDAVVNAVGPILRKHGVIVAPTVQSVAYDTVSTSTGKPATACRVLVIYTFYASDGSSIATTVAAEAWDAGDKAAPKAMSVAFRTALLQSLALPTDEPDPDSHTYERTTTEHTEAVEQPTRRMSRPSANGEAHEITSAQLKKLGAGMREAGITERAAALEFVAATIGREVSSRNDLTRAEASQVIDALERNVAFNTSEPEPDFEGAP